MKRQTQTSEAADGLLTSIAMQLRGVMGEIQERSDVVLVGNYERDRAACEAAIEKALTELNEAGFSADEKSDDFDLSWAWHGLNEAYARLGRVVSRAHLARRRQEVKEQRAEKARLRAQQEG